MNLTFAQAFPNAVVAIALVALATDLKFGKIFNALTLPAFGLGLLAAGLLPGGIGFGQSLLGAGVGLILLGWMFALGMLGGGDVKLMMAFGAWGGARFAAETTLLTIMLGGAMALGFLIARGRLLGAQGFARRMLRFLVTSVTPNLEVEWVTVDRTQTMPFGVPLSIAAIWTALAPPLERWGIHLW